MLNKVSAWRTLRFAITGAISLGAYYATYILLTEMGTHYILSSVLGFLAYWMSNFFINRNWTFMCVGNIQKQASQHFAMHLVNQALIMIGLYVLIEYLGLHYLMAQVILTVLITVEVFVLSHIIFRT